MHAIQRLQSRIALAVDIVFGVIAVPPNTSKQTASTLGPDCGKSKNMQLLLREHRCAWKVSWQDSNIIKH